MEQLAKVRQTNGNGMARVVVVRESACSGDCHKCSGCGAIRETLFVRAENRIGADVGDHVVVETATHTVMKAVLLVYLVPVVLFFAGYVLGAVLSFLPGLTGALGFALGIIPAVFLNRRMEQKKESTFRITGFAQEF